MDVCRTTNQNVAVQKVLDEKNFVTFLVWLCVLQLIYFHNIIIRLIFADSQYGKKFHVQNLFKRNMPLDNGPIQNG